MGTKVRRFLLWWMVPLLFIACQSGSREVDLSGIESDVELLRFDQDLKSLTADSAIYDLGPLRERYGEFFELYVHRVLGIPQGNDTAITAALRHFLEDPEIREIMAAVDSAFGDMSEVKKSFDEFLKHYQYYHPGQPVPDIITCVSAFNYAVITTDSAIAISLEMFISSTHPFYDRLGIPRYLSGRFSREYIVASAIRGWFESEYDQEAVKKELLSRMIYLGKQQYYMEAMAPHLPDTIRAGYTADQLQWCNNNEASVWKYFIENKLLFNTIPKEYAKYVSDGPAAGGFPKEAPGKIGAWTGYRIVKEFMNKNSETTLEALLAIEDANLILEQSGYKPKR